MQTFGYCGKCHNMGVSASKGVHVQCGGFVHNICKVCHIRQACHRGTDECTRILEWSQIPKSERPDVTKSVLQSIKDSLSIDPDWVSDGLPPHHEIRRALQKVITDPANKFDGATWWKETSVIAAVSETVIELNRAKATAPLTTEQILKGSAPVAASAYDDLPPAVDEAAPSNYEPMQRDNEPHPDAHPSGGDPDAKRQNISPSVAESIVTPGSADLTGRMATCAELTDTLRILTAKPELMPFYQEMMSLEAKKTDARIAEANAAKAANEKDARIAEANAAKAANEKDARIAEANAAKAAAEADATKSANEKDARIAEANAAADATKSANEKDARIAEAHKDAKIAEINKEVRIAKANASNDRKVRIAEINGAKTVCTAAKSPSVEIRSRKQLYVSLESVVKELAVKEQHVAEVQNLVPTEQQCVTKGEDQADVVMIRRGFKAALARKIPAAWCDAVPSAGHVLLKKLLAGLLPPSAAGDLQRLANHVYNHNANAKLVKPVHRTHFPKDYEFLAADEQRVVNEIVLQIAELRQLIRPDAAEASRLPSTAAATGDPMLGLSARARQPHSELPPDQEMTMCAILTKLGVFKRLARHDIRVVPSGYAYKVVMESKLVGRIVDQGPRLYSTNHVDVIQAAEKRVFANHLNNCR